MIWEKSKHWFERAVQVIPGGVNSPVRAFKAVGGGPLFINRGYGSRLIDVDGNAYIDYVSSFGPLILGHAHPQVVEAVTRAATSGTSYGASCPAEVELAEMIIAAFPAMEQVRMVNSGTEATMSAIRLARAYTGRDIIIKFEGCYHGHGDSFLIQAGSGLLTTGQSTSPGIPAALVGKTMVSRYNDIDSVKAIFDEYPDEIAAVIVEPVPANMGLVLPEPGFLENLRSLTQRYGALLIFDEVITGFRISYGGFQTTAGIAPDLTTLGKIIGGGLPVGAYGGRREIMARIAPEGDVYQAGTLSGNPVAMAAGITTLSVLRDGDCYDRLTALTQQLVEGLESVLAQKGYRFSINTTASMFTMFCTASAVRGYADVLSADTDFYARFHREMLKEGIYLPPSQFEVCFLSDAHDQEDIHATVAAWDRVLDRI